MWVCMCVCVVSVCVCVGVCMRSVVPRPSLSPVFDCMLQAIKTWRRGRPGNNAMHVCMHMRIAQVCTVMCTVMWASCQLPLAFMLPFSPPTFPLNLPPSLSVMYMSAVSVLTGCFFYHHPLPSLTHPYPLTLLPLYRQSLLTI